ncbi:substrate-binding domain-containing protein [Vulcaniibacterium tengchongense]|uniref:Phosphate ABC transporter substrate-binding protein (PhoT family) n=1 Tax=Vulcaniibacterium tengchongense TaxID=1273429 RepID=A0A3N4V4N6_9GAMM|nr:substrate-binding domain-containing protein [Vulcaniibacterium tengchongense]RPE77013.1 phosphate ABC transporter substrate-binding protein (PhoT family) [Vulcaniibacterium tengchongense]
MSRAIVVLLLFLFHSVCAQAQGEPERMRIHGSQTLAAKLVPAVAEAWLRDIGYVGIRREQPAPNRTELHASRDGQPLVVEIVASSSAQGFAALVDGRAQIAMTTRRPTAAELDAGWQLGDLASHDQEFALALDGAAVVVNRANPVAKLSLRQLRALFSGEIRHWSELGAGAGPVRLHRVDGANSARDLIDERVMQGARHAAAQRHADAPALLRAIAADPWGIGFVSLRQGLGAGVRPVAIEEGGRAIAPTRVGVQSEDYPLTRRLYLYGSQMMGALSRSFALYAMGRRGQDAVARAGHFALTLRPGQRQASLAGPGDYRALVDGAQRLPLSLRFNLTGQNDSGIAASVYDSRAVRDLERLEAFMRLPPNRGRRLLVIGFADGTGPAATSLMMSNDRADLVAQELISRGLVVERVRGMGAALPLARTGAPGDRYRNERVEVWLR